MANSNRRIKKSETVHHIVSRIAHKVYFLREEERKDFLEIVRRAAKFSGVRLIGWCVMENHFHLLVYLPSPVTLDEEEVLRRYGYLKGESSAMNQECVLSEWRKNGESGERRVADWLDGQRRRMYDIGEFMKIVKQWFTMEYNSRNAHKGTLWESAYFDRPVKRVTTDMAKCLGYIHLNPVRAGMTDRFDGYQWSSYSAFCKGDEIALAGMRFIYGEEMSQEEIVGVHENMLYSLLEEEKLHRAEEIARKRNAGYEAPSDPLTNEAMIAQQFERMKAVSKAALELHEANEYERRRSSKRKLREREILLLLKSNPEIDVPSLAEKMELSTGIVYRHLREMKKAGVISQDGYGGRWMANIEK